jgi:tetratricopeptide (TPR) repeat protein
LQLRAALRFRQGEQQEGIDDMRRVVAINPSLDEVLVGLMIELIRQGRDGDALTVASGVIDQRPSDSTLMMVCARVFAERELWNRAAVMLARAWSLRESPEVGLLYVDSLVNSRPSNPDEGDRVIQRLVQLGEKLETSPTLLISSALVSAARERPQSATEFMGRALAAADGDSVKYVNWIRNLGRVFADRRSREFTDESRASALAFLRQLEGQFPAGAVQRPWIEYARAQVMSGDPSLFEEGLSAYRIVTDGNGPPELRRLAYQGLGGALYDADRYAEAEEAWAAGVVAFSDAWEMQNNLAYSMAVKSGRAAEALSIAEAAAEALAGRSDARSQTLDTLARVQTVLGRYDEAEATLNDAEASVNSTASRVNITLGRARVAIGRKDCQRAQAYLSEAESQLSTLPQIRDRFEDDLKALAEQIGSDC